MIPFNIDKILERIDMSTLMTSVFIASLSSLYFNSLIYFLIFFSGTYLVITIFIVKIIKFIKDKYYIYAKNKIDRKQKEEDELYIKSILYRMYKNNDWNVINWILNLPKDNYYKNVFTTSDIHQASSLNVLVERNNLYYPQNKYNNRKIPLITYDKEGSFLERVIALTENNWISDSFKVSNVCNGL